MNTGNLAIPFSIALIFSFALTRIVIFICRKYSIYDLPGRHKRHKTPTPNLGGAAVFISGWSTIAFMYFIDPAFSGDIAIYLPYIFVGSLIIFLVGLIDDLSPLPAWSKLAAEIITGMILYFGGLSINLLTLPELGSIGLSGFGVVITILWVVGLTNAINLIDGLDGLASGISSIAALTLAVIGLNFHVASVTVISLILFGALVSFWFHNRYPAKIFLGDSGSLLIGYFFAIISLIVPIKSFTLAALFIPLVALGVPLVETASSFIRRIIAGKSIMQADRRHLFHYLRYAGLSRKLIVNLFYLLGAVFSLISLLMLTIDRVIATGVLVLFMVVIFIIYFILVSKIRRST